MSRSTRKAVFACLFFASIGTLGWLKTGLVSTESFLLLVYYGVLVVNTFFSIQVFSAITPKSRIQTLFDTVLAGIYCALAFSFGSALFFSSVSAGLFLMAIAKYVHLNGLIGSRELLQRKIKINSLGAMLSVLAFGIGAFGFTEIAAWILCTVLFLANIYVLIINPMYRLNP